MKYKNFSQMEVWQLSVNLASEIYQITDKNKFKFDFSFKDQIRRSAVSIPSNIAEGFERNSKKEFIRFLNISKGSSGELYTQLLIAKNTNYISKEVFDQLNQKIKTISKSLGGLIKALSNYVK